MDVVLSENCALRGHYAASSDNLLPTFRDTRSLKMVPIGRPETSVINYQYWLLNDPEERSCHLFRGGSLKSRVLIWYLIVSVGLAWSWLCLATVNLVGIEVQIRTHCLPNAKEDIRLIVLKAWLGRMMRQCVWIFVPLTLLSKFDEAFERSCKLLHLLSEFVPSLL